jgi:hypothetical protein
MNEEQVRALMLFLNVGMKVLSARVVLILTLLLCFSLFCWAMYLPDQNRIAAATIFAVLVFLPVIRSDMKAGEGRKPLEGE